MDDGCRIEAVAAGVHQTCAIIAGDILCWGDNASGQSDPTRVGSGSVGPTWLDQRGSRLSVGDGLACATYGPPICWGRSESSGRAGPGPHLMGLWDHRVRDVAIGSLHACWLVDGDPSSELPRAPQLHCAGMYDEASWRDASQRTARAVEPPFAPRFDLFGVRAGGLTTCFYGSDSLGPVLACRGGAPPDGPVTSTASSTPGFESREPWATVAVGGTHMCMVDPEGAVWCLGEGRDGALGSAVANRSDTPLRVALPDSADTVCVSAGVTLSSDHTLSRLPAHSCALLASGEVWCWGAHDLGQLGTRGLAHGAPRRVVTLPSTPLTSIALSCGGTHTCALDGEGHLRCWGDESHGAVIGQLDEDGVRHWGTGS
jgi:Regulator of chromosome condensation (RCC1) repeat